MIRSICLALMTVMLAVVTGWAQPSPVLNAADIKLRLEKLDTLGSVLYIAAHPDDENTRLLGYLAKEKLYRTGYLSLTRGDGGQNLVGNEQGELLGLIRTQELLAARRIDGAEQFFTRANDFGFSKNPAETFTIWDRNKILGDVVWMIRKFQPDVIVCRFPPDSRAGHGHHTASAMLAAEAYEAAADPTKFPEQLKTLKPWKAHRILWNTFNFSGDRDPAAGDGFYLNVGKFNYLLGRGYGEIAAESRSQHKSQGFGVPAARGSSYEYFDVVKGDAPKYSLMDGVNSTWTRLEGGKAIGEMVDKVKADYQVDNPPASVPALLNIRKAILALPDGYWRNQKLLEVEQLILASAGIWAEAYSNSEIVVPGQRMQGSVQMICNSNITVKVQQLSFAGKEDSKADGASLKDNELRTFPQELTVPENTPETQPYWLSAPHPIGEYTITDPSQVGYPENKPALTAVIRLQINGEELTVTRPVQYKHTDPVKGEVYAPLIVAPPVTGSLNNSVYIFSEATAQVVPVKLRAMGDHTEGTVSLRLPAGFNSQEQNVSFNLASKGDETTLLFHVRPLKVNGNHTDTLRVVMNVNGKEYTQNIRTISYDHIPNITLFPDAAARLVTVDLKHNGRKLGYIAGAGDMVASSLQQVGYEITMLDEKEIMSGDLSQYDAIITGVRVYNINPRIKYWQPRLMEYVKNGGTLLVQYNVNGPLMITDLGPYPFTLSRDRVTDETAKVDFLQPGEEVMHYPNNLNQQDFDGWIQERGLYFTQNADPAYKRLFAMHDKGESPLDGSTLVAAYGKGRYVYTSLDFFRELPAGVPGAYRLFVNLITPKK